MYQPNQFFPQTQQIFSQQSLKGRPVSSLEEVRATSIDFDGSVFYFPDLANKRIYTKQINADGTSTLNMYEFKPIQPSVNSNYVTREEFENALKQIQNILQNKNTEEAKPQTSTQTTEFNF